MDSTAKTITIALTVISLAAGAALVMDGRTGDWLAVRQEPPHYQPPTETKPVATTLFFAGDIMLSREVKGKMAAAGDVTLPYQKVKDEIQSADVSFANLESPFSPTNINPSNRLVFQAEPLAIQGLVDAGFDILSTANNHAFDQGRAGVEYTLAWLEEHGLVPAGTGLDCHDGQVVEADGMKIGYLAYSYAAYNDGGASKDPLSCDWNDTEQMKLDVAAMRPRADFLVVSAHMGQEYKRVPEEKNIQAARAAIDAGADAVIGHHPHWHQIIEEYRGKFIFYSLGNFVFDQMWSQETREGLAVKMLFNDKKLDTITLMPVVIDEYCCPRWANEDETKSILGKINLTSPVLFGKN